MDILDTNDYIYIQNILNHFILYTQLYVKTNDKEKRPWIKDAVMYEETTRGV